MPKVFLFPLCFILTQTLISIKISKFIPVYQVFFSLFFFLRHSVRPFSFCVLVLWWSAKVLLMKSCVCFSFWYWVSFFSHYIYKFPFWSAAVVLAKAVIRTVALLLLIIYSSFFSQCRAYVLKRYVSFATFVYSQLLFCSDGSCGMATGIPGRHSLKSFSSSQC